jgi:lipid II:glycine glycyltransferase (peptidoglycan interpeptide bridge formation enzyme)
MPDIRQNEFYAKYIEKIGWDVEKFSGSYCYIKKFPIGSIIKIQRPAKLIGDGLLSYLVNKYKFCQIYIEPSDDKQYRNLLKKGFKKYNSPFLPTKTVQIDLEKSGNSLLTKMHPKARYNIKHAEKLGVRIETSDDIDKFANFWQKTSLSWGMFIPETRNIKEIYLAFEDGAKIFFAIKDDKVLGGILLISTKEISYYVYAAYSDQGKKLFAPTLLVWEAIKYAKNKKKKIFDFEGVFDERYPLKAWKGFSRFKQSFGGKVIEFPGPLVKSNLPFGITF